MCIAAIKKLIFLLIFTVFIHEASKANELSVYDLSCDGQTNPLGIDSPQPVFGWKIKSALRNVSQVAYEIRVGKNPKLLPLGKQLSWHSGKVSTDQSIHIDYQGETLASGERYYWQVRIWDNHGKVSPWSAVQHWEMGLLKPTDWKARWIKSGKAVEGEGPATLFRKVFKLGGDIQQARLYITAHGIYEAFINGQRVGQDYFTPGWTSYHKRLQYQVYDIKTLLNKDENTIGVALGDGWFRGNFAGGRNFYGREEALLAQISVEYKNGTVAHFVTDDTWQFSTEGPIRKSDIYNGEYYDAGSEKEGWSLPGFDAKPWGLASINSDIPVKQLVATVGPPVRKKEVFQPKARFTNKKGEKIIDFGQNLVGWVRFQVKGKAGDSVLIRHAEVLDKDGNFYTDNLRKAKQTNTYKLKGGGLESYEPHFSYQGFRYIKVEGNVDLLDVQAFALYSDMATTGVFETSDPLINQLQHNILWGQKGNFLDIPTDCNQRDERVGWTGDAQIFFNTSTFNKDVSRFFTKWLRDLKVDQKPSGMVPDVIPNFGGGDGGVAGWADAATIIPWEFYRHYGDARLLANQYESMKAVIGYIQSQSKEHLWNKGFQYGDWLFYTPADDKDGRAAITDKFLIAQAFYINSLQIVIHTAGRLRHTEDVRKYQALFDQARAAFLKEYVTPSGRLVSGTQTAYVLALQFDILPDSLRLSAVDRLVENIKSYGNHLTTGFLGTSYLCPVLSRFGHDELAYTLLMQKDYPSWLYPITKGATTIWERWDGIKPDGSFQTPEMNSFNHYAYGAIGDWMYQNIAGIKLKDNAVAYKEFIIAPKPGGGLTHAKGELTTLYGKIKSSWVLEGKQFKLSVVVPENTRAAIVFPSGTDISTLSEGGEKIVTNAGQYQAGSGNYEFTMLLNK